MALLNKFRKNRKGESVTEKPENREVVSNNDDVLAKLKSIPVPGGF